MSTSDDGFLRSWFRMSRTKGISVPSVKAVGALTATGATPWVRVTHVPSAYFAQITGTSGAVTATAHFEFGDDIPGLPVDNQASVAPAGVGTTITLSGTGAGVGSATVASSGALVGAGMFGADASVSPLVPWKYCRLVVTALSGTGAQVVGFQNLGEA